MVTNEKQLLVEDLINDPNFDSNKYEGYIYLTTCLITGRKYLGKKSFRHNLNKKLGKKELANLPITRGRTPTTKKVTQDSKWADYYGSAEEIKQNLKNNGPKSMTRNVLRLCVSKKELTYYENKYLFSYGVLEDSSVWINDNIEGRYFSKDFNK